METKMKNTVKKKKMEKSEESTLEEMLLLDTNEPLIGQIIFEDSDDDIIEITDEYETLPIPRVDNNIDINIISSDKTTDRNKTHLEHNNNNIRINKESHIKTPILTSDSTNRDVMQHQNISTKRKHISFPRTKVTTRKNPIPCPDNVHEACEMSPVQPNSTMSHSEQSFKTNEQLPIDDHKNIVRNIIHFLYRVSKWISDPSKRSNKIKLREYIYRQRNIYFTRCYSSALRLLVPRKMDSSFIAKFVSSIANISMKGGLTVKLSLLHKTVMDLINWCVIRAINSNQQPIVNPHGVSGVGSIQKQYSEATATEVTKTFTGPLGQTIQISYNPAIVAKKIASSATVNETEEDRIICDKYYHIRRLLSSDPMVYHNEHQKDDCTPVMSNHQWCISNKQNLTSPSDLNAYSLCDNVTSQPTPHFYSNFGPTEHNITPPPPYYANHYNRCGSHFNKQNNELQPKNIQEISSNENILLFIERSSVSRDSGFFNAEDAPMTNAEMSVHNNGSNLDSHHISFTNENTSSQTKNNRCMTCNQFTTTVCLGCYKVYYCSQSCQNAQWAKHKDVCMYTTPP